MTYSKTARLRSGYHHVTSVVHVFPTQIRPPQDIITPYIWLTRDGVLTVWPEYALDGATWFPDVSLIMRAVVLHDALYQLIRERLLPYSWRDAADLELKKAILQDGDFVAKNGKTWLARQTAPKAAAVLAPSVYLAVKTLGASAATPGSGKPPREYPCPT